MATITERGAVNALVERAFTKLVPVLEGEK